MQLHEALARHRERARVTGAQALFDGVRRKSAAEHGVINAFARRGRDDAGRIAGENDVAAIVPALERL